MFARLVFVLVLGMLRYVPRPADPSDGPGSGPPPSPDDLPPGDGDPGDWSPYVPAPSDPPADVIPFEPKAPWDHGRPGGPLPSVPPTPPPGYEGAWPPGSSVPDDRPPTPPPGFEGDWGNDTGRSIRDQVRDLLQQIRDLLRRDDATPTHRHDADHGVKLLGGELKTPAVEDDPSGSPADL